MGKITELHKDRIKIQNIKYHTSQ